ncbi:MAG TPA: alkaline phosphatase D family protein [Blastocatellia bacterium]|nr:alkaline phosphatase D family protein [Blastocatellia bacterium]
MKKRLLPLFLIALILISPLASARQAQTSQSPPPTPRQPGRDTRPLLRSGPMLGYSDITQTEVWLQTEQPADVQLRFWKQADPASARLSAPARTAEERDLIARFTLSGLEFGTKYDYEVYINGARVTLPYPTTFQTQPMWRWRSDPPAFRIAIGSCAYVNDPPYDRPGRAYGGDYEVFTTLHQQKPDLMIWMGDNIYYREADWLNEEAMRYRYAQNRALKELQPLLASVHNYATWDDHDYGPNDSDRTFRLKDASLRIFKDYWANMTYGSRETPGVFGRFEWADVEFFLLDDRYHRSPNHWPVGPDKVMLGEAQMRWLLESLRSSQATFKIVVNGNQVLNPVTLYETLTNFPSEQKRLLDFIRDNKISGVVFLSGDRHHTELIKRVEPGMYPLYDFTSSPLTAGTGRNEREANNPARVPDTWVTGVRNFGLIDVAGPARDRRLTLRAIDLTGKEWWKFEIRAADLQFPDDRQR